MTDLADATRATQGILDDEAMVRRIFAHLDGGTTDLSDDAWREPVANYHSPTRLAAELDVLRRYPVAFCPSAALAEPGSYLARDAAGVALVAVRGQDGIVRTFRNSCRHRGTAVAEASGCAKSLVCPYHGWVYRLDGALRHVPDEYGFPGLDKDSRGLVAVDTREVGGMVFVTQDAPVAPVADALADIPHLLGADQEYLGVHEGVVEANWKVFLEGFLEGYHIKATHPDTFFPFGYDNVNVIERFGRNSRVTFPFRRIEGLRDRPAEEWNVDGLLTYVYQLFPNTVVAQLSHHTSIAVLEPVAPDRTKLVTYMLTNRNRGTSARQSAAKDADFVVKGAAQDRAMVERVQRGLSSGANDAIEFGRFEGALVHFHRQLRELLDTTAP